MNNDQLSRGVSSLANLLPSDTVNALLAGNEDQLHAPLAIVDDLGQYPRLLATQCLGEQESCQGCDLKQLAADALQLYREGKAHLYQRQCTNGRYCLLHLITWRDEPLAAVRVGPLDANAEQSSNPSDVLKDGLTHVAGQIQQYANISTSKRTFENQRECLKNIRAAIRHCGFSDGAPTLPAVREVVNGLLGELCDFCGMRYAALFTDLHANEWVLAPIGWAKLPLNILDDLPHFNWKKSGLPPTLVINGPYVDGTKDYVAKGLRGKNIDFFQNVDILLPVQMGKRHRGVFIFGPRSSTPPPDTQFLMEACDTISSYAFTEVDFLLKEQEAKRWQSTAQLIQHQVGTVTCQIINLIDVVLQTPAQSPLKVTDRLRLAKAQCFELATSARRTLEGRLVDEFYADDLQKELFPLAVLVENCVESFSQGEEIGGRTFNLDDSVLRLPSAEVDIARLSIALSNILHNGLKYSFPNTVIYIRATSNFLDDPDHPCVTIQVDDLGEEIPLAEQQSIFKQGVRGQKHAHGRIEGYGLGLWEARSIIRAHGGSLSVSCEPTSVVRSQGRGFKVIFSITLPLHNKGNKS